MTTCVRTLLLAALVAGVGCEQGAREARPGPGSPRAVPPARAVADSPARLDVPESWPSGLSEREMLVRLRSHYQESARAARVVQASASSAAVRTEVDWLLQVYDHFAEHFDTSLRDWYGPAALAQPPIALNEYTDPATLPDVRERERTFAAEVARNHGRLMAFVRSPEYERYSAQRELLREIRLDVETSEATEVKAFQAAVQGSH